MSLTRSAICPACRWSQFKLGICCLQTAFHHCLICKHLGCFKKKHSIYLFSSTNIWEIYQESRLTMISNDFQHTSSKHSNSPFEPQRSQPLPLPAFQPGHFGYQQKHGENMGKWSENISDSTTHFHDFPWKVAEIMFSCEFLKPLWAWIDQWMND